ncbi:MAG: KOW domain-containing RNA-binding protein [Clostridia bacterium]|nr:KOW domain-containing RNA-binding protein [Clostridia bacterium]
MVTNGDVQLGQLVISKAGRDKEKAYLIAKILDESFVAVVDGSLRKLTQPKRKNIKHLQVTNKVASEIREKLLAGARLEDEQVRQVIQELLR